MPAVPVLTQAGFRRAVDALAAADADLGRVVAGFGRPPMRRREQGFATLVLLILEQQVSLASARATFDRLMGRVGAVEPARILALGEDELRALGLSRQKARYVGGLAESVRNGALDLARLPALPDAAAHAALVGVTGIGDWTADVYLMTALRRPDVWPAKDLALAVATQEVKRLGARPGPAELAAVGEAWRPQRAVAARILWHHYLNTKRRGAGGRPT